MSSENKTLRRRLVQITQRKKMPAARKMRIRALICGLPAGNFPLTREQGAWVQPESQPVVNPAGANTAKNAQ